MRNFSHFLTAPHTLQNVHESKFAMLEKLVKLVNLLVDETLFSQHVIIEQAFTYFPTLGEHLLWARQNEVSQYEGHSPHPMELTTQRKRRTNRITCDLG